MTDKTLKGLYKFCEEKSKNIKLKAEPQVFVELCNALEELKCYQEQHNIMCEYYEVATVEDIYNKAIDDYNRELKEYLRKFTVHYVSDKDFDYIAEQLRGGKNDD